jgi:hypothetical protein
MNQTGHIQKVFSEILLCKINLNSIIKILFTSFIIIFLSTSLLEAAKKKDEKTCLYCDKFKKLKDWPVEARPKAFIYEKIDYPKGMFSKSQKKAFNGMMKASGAVVYKRFVKSKGSLNTYQHLMVRDMAYFESYFNEMLNDKNSKVETLEGLKKGRESMRLSLKISPKASSSEAVLKFWATGKMLKQTHDLNKKQKKKRLKAKIDPEIADRAAILSNLKKQVAIAKVNAQRAAVIEAQKKTDGAK